MIERSKWLRLGRLAGVCASIVCVGFVVHVLWRQWEVFEQMRDIHPIVVVICILLWLFLDTLLGVGWANLISIVRKSLPFARGILVAWESQIAKYLPGNVFHVVGRVVSGRRFGVAATDGTRATFLESGILIGLGSAFGLPALWLGESAWCVTVFLVLCVAFGLLWLPSLPLVQRILPASLRGGKAEFGCVLMAIFSYLCVFLAQAAIFILLMSSLAPELEWSHLEVVNVVALAWVVGFVTIGSPGGLGVREAVFAGIAPSGQEAAVLLCAAGLRMAGVLGDLLAFLISRSISRILGTTLQND